MVSAADAREALEAIVWQHLPRGSAAHADEILAAADAFAVHFAAEHIGKALASASRSAETALRRHRARTAERTGKAS